MAKSFNPLADPCFTCGVWKGKLNPCIRPKEVSGGKQRPIVICGEGPGEDEDSKGEAFVGRSGKLLRKILDELNVSNRAIFINAVRCRPTTATGANRTPTRAEISLCRCFTVDDLAGLDPQPECIICLGQVAATAFGLVGRENLKTLRFKKFYVYEPEYKYVAAKEPIGPVPDSQSIALPPHTTTRLEPVKQTNRKHNMRQISLSKRQDSWEDIHEPETTKKTSLVEALEGPRIDPEDKTAIPLYVTYHPAAGLRPGMANLIKEMRDDLARFLSTSTNGSAGLPDTDYGSFKGDPLGGAAERTVTVDIETDGFLKDGKALPFSEGQILLVGAEEG